MIHCLWDPDPTNYGNKEQLSARDSPHCIVWEGLGISNLTHASRVDFFAKLNPGPPGCSGETLPLHLGPSSKNVENDKEKTNYL